MLITMDTNHYEVPEPVVKRMDEYYSAMKAAAKELAELKRKVERLRTLQRQYFTNRAPDILRACKALEREIDDYLSGVAAFTKPEQQELFR